MNNLNKIFILLLLTGIFSSCAKDEVEAPSQSSEEKVYETKDVLKDDIGYMSLEAVDLPGTMPASINDDGDDEDEDRTLITVE